MEIFQIFWLFFLLSALQPLIQRRVLEFQRKKLMARLMRLFPQPTRRTQTMEYSPVERRVPRDKS